MRSPLLVLALLAACATSPTEATRPATIKEQVPDVPVAVPQAPVAPSVPVTVATTPPAPVTPPVVADSLVAPVILPPILPTPPVTPTATPVPTPPAAPTASTPTSSPATPAPAVPLVLGNVVYRFDCALVAPAVSCQGEGTAGFDGVSLPAGTSWVLSASRTPIGTPPSTGEFAVSVWYNYANGSRSPASEKFVWRFVEPGTTVLGPNRYAPVPGAPQAAAITITRLP